MLYNNGQKKRGAALSFRPTALIYLLFLIFALVFTQLLRSTAKEHRCISIYNAYLRSNAVAFVPMSDTAMSS